MIGVAQCQADIDFTHEQVLHQLLAVQAGQLARGAGVAPGPFADQGRQQRKRQRRCGPDAQGLSRLVAQVLGQPPHTVDTGRHLVHFALQLQRFGRHQKLALDPQKQSEAQLRFGVLQGFGHRWLADMQQLRRPADGPRLANRLEHLDMSESHVLTHNLYLYPAYLYSLSARCHAHYCEACLQKRNGS
ncbi:hypothetical protein D9M71_563310 [compost metagenome]